MSYYASFHREEPKEREYLQGMLYNAVKSGPYGPLIGGFLTQMLDQAIAASNTKRKPSMDRPGFEGERAKCSTWNQLEYQE